MIRAATTADVPVIIELIHELAEYEREPDAVEITPDDLSAALFGAQPQVFCSVAHDDDGSPVGIAIWFLTFSTWTGRHGIYLEDLVVREKNRGSGYGRALMANLANICVERGYRRLEWAVLDWNEDAIRFYRSLQARPNDGWIVNRLDGPALLDLAKTAGS
jgi:GNAT superfamily N-acetyltransferase